MTDFSYLFNCVVVGDSGVGKSCLLLRYANNAFSETFLSTIGIDFKTKVVPLETGERAKLLIWDTAGQERFRTITRSYFRGAQGAMLCFDITNYASFLSLERWISEVKAHGTDDIAFVLVGTKNDIQDRREVSREEAVHFASKHNMLFVETSAKNDKGVRSAFDALARVVHARTCALDKREKSKRGSSKARLGAHAVDLVGEKAKNKRDAASTNCCV